MHEIWTESADTGTSDTAEGVADAGPGRIARDPRRDIVLHGALPSGPWEAPHTARLPGTVPLLPGNWFTVDEAYGGQMALRERLIARHRDRVIAALPTARRAVCEMYDAALRALEDRPDFGVGRSCVLRPDGVRVARDPDDPLGTLGRLVAEDLCVLEKPDGASEHVLTAAVLCFPSHWTLAEKLGLPMGRIHVPVRRYTAEVARRVQRLLDGLAPGRMLMRMNALPTDLPWLFTPGREADSREVLAAGLPYLRSERQIFVRLPRTGAIVFSIQTRLLPRQALSPEQAEGLAAYLAEHRGIAAEAATPDATDRGPI